MRKSKYYVKKRGGADMHINRNAHPFANNMPQANDMQPTNNMQMNNNMQMKQMDMTADQIPTNNCPPCVCPPSNAEPENKPKSLTDKVMGFNNALATKPGQIFNSAKSNSLNALNEQRAKYSNKIINFLQPAAKAQPEINVGGRRRRTRRKRRGTRTRTKTKRRGTKTKRRRRTRR